MAAPRKIDYERVEPDWRAGLKCPAQIAAEYTAATGVSVSHAAIIKHFKKLGVPRDLASKIKAKADAIVTASMVTGKVSSVTNKTDAQIIDGSAVVVATVQVAHRSDIRRAKALSLKLLAELESQTDNGELFEQLAQLLIDPVDADEPNDATRKAHAKRMEALQAALSLAGRTKIMKDLGDSLKTLIGLEREAFGLDDKKSGTASPGNIFISI